MEPFDDKHKEQGPLTADTGGTSKSDPTAGTGSQDPQDNHKLPREIGTADRAGAAIITVVVSVSWIGMMLWMVIGD
ncbi:hypothetical protein EYZ11_003606 [Aspergillus tanneri]|nr:hypothetical protein EYZ11_003606 [Aspergillus tanneri]